MIIMTIIPPRTLGAPFAINGAQTGDKPRVPSPNSLSLSISKLKLKLGVPRNERKFKTIMKKRSMLRA